MAGIGDELLGYLVDTSAGEEADAKRNLATAQFANGGAPITVNRNAHRPSPVVRKRTVAAAYANGRGNIGNKIADIPSSAPSFDVPAVDNGFGAINEAMPFDPGFTPEQIPQAWDNMANAINRKITGPSVLERLQNGNPPTRDMYGDVHDLSAPQVTNTPEWAKPWAEQNAAYDNAMSKDLMTPIKPQTAPVPSPDDPADIPEKYVIRQILGNTAMPFLGGYRWLAENTPLGALYGDAPAEIGRAVQDWQNHPADFETDWGRDVGQHIASIGSSLAQMALAGMTKYPLTAIGAMSGGSEYFDQRERGVDPFTATIAAGLNGATESGLEKLSGFGEGANAMKELFGAIGKGSFKDAAGRAGRVLTNMALREEPSELATTPIQSLISTATDPTHTPSDIAPQMVDTFWDTAGMGIGLGGVGGTLNTAAKVMENRQDARRQAAMSNMQDRLNGLGFPTSPAEAVDVYNALARPNIAPMEQAARENPTGNAAETGRRALDISRQRKREDATVRRVNERANANVLSTGTQMAGNNVVNPELADKSGNQVLMDYMNAVKNARIHTAPTGGGEGPELKAEENSTSPEIPSGVVKIDGRAMNVPGRKGVTVEHINERIKDNPALKATNVVQSIENLPEDVQAEIHDELKAQGMEGRADLVEGYRSKRTGQAFLIGDNLKPERVEEVARHETIGHYGLQGMMDETEKGSYDKLMNDISSSIESNKVLQQLRDEVMKSQPGITGFQLAEEIAAKMAERNMHNTFTQRIFGAIRRFLHKAGLIKGNVTEAQLSKYLRDSQKWLANGNGIRGAEWSGMMTNKAAAEGAGNLSVSETADQKYMNAVRSGDNATASKMVREQAASKGYQTAKDKFTDLDSLRQLADDSESLNVFSIANGISIVPDNYFSYFGLRMYGQDSKAGRESLNGIMQAMESIRRQMEKFGEVREMPTITVYRAVPNNVEDGKLRSDGEWVSPSRTYAKGHGESRFGSGEYRIIKEKVSAENLWWDGNDINEWGFDDGNKYLYKNTKNNRKSLDAVTYDSKGNPIPLSKRFDETKRSSNFSLSEEQKDEAVKEIFDSTKNKAINDELDHLKSILGVSKDDVLNDVKQRWVSEFERRRGKIGKNKDIYKKDIFDAMQQKWIDYHIEDKIKPDDFKMTTTLPADASVEANIEHGRDAIRKAIQTKSDVDNAMYRPDAGWIDFKWGKVGKIKIESGKTDGWSGVYHILIERLRKDGITEDKSLADMDKIVETIARGKPGYNQTFDNPNANVLIVHGNSGAVLSRDKNQKAWMLTGWGDIPGSGDIAVQGADADTHPIADPDDDRVGAGHESNITQKDNENNTLSDKNNGNLSLSEDKKESEGRVLNREPSSFNEREQQVFDDFMSKRHDADRIKDNLKKYAGTGWAKQAVEAVFVRQAMNDLMNGVEPDYESSMDFPNVRGLRKDLLEGGIDALRNRAIENGLIGNASKPINNVNSSFLNCNPSKACAKYCYATKGNYRYANVIVKSEMVTMLVEMDPKWTAEQVADQYKRTREFHEEKALRLFDKGDGDKAWIPFIKELNKQDIRVQIFSKRPDFLRQVPDVNLRLLSIDESNMELADQNPDLPVAFVYAGEEQIDMLSKLADRDQIGVVLPVKVGRSVLHKEKVDALKEAVPAVKEFLCPIDAGYKTIGKTGTKNKEGKINWNCTMCDKAGGVGCYHGRVTKAIMEARAKVDASLLSADTPAELKAMQAQVLREALELKGMLDAYYSRINQQESGDTEGELGTDPQVRRTAGGLGARISDELGSKLQWLLQSIDDRTADTAAGMAGRKTEEVRSGRSEDVREGLDKGTGRRVIPLKLVGENEGNNQRSDKGRGNGRGNLSVAEDESQDDTKNVGFFVPDITVADNIIRAFQDQDVDIKRVEDAILKAGGAINDESDVYLNKTLYISKVADRLERMNEEFTDPILTLINESGVSFDEASDWLYARHVFLDDVNQQLADINENANADDALSGMSDGDAENIYKKHSGNKKLQEMAKLVDKLMQRNVRILVNSGLLTPEEATAWSNKYEHYVPLKRDNLGIRSETAWESAKKWWKARGNAFKVKAEKNGPTGGMPKAGGVETRGKESKRRMGSERRATNILGNVFASATAGIMRSQKQETAHAVLKLAQDNPNPDFWTVDKKEMVKRVNPQTGLVEITYRDPDTRPKDNIFVVKVDGIEHWVKFNENNARAMEMCKALKAADAPQLMWITQAIGQLTRWTGGWLTTHNPVFALFNFMRDQQHMMFNLEDTPLKGKQLQVYKNMPGAMKGVWEVTRGERVNSKWAKYFDEFKRNGGETGFINNFANINDRVTDLKKRQKELARGKLNPRKWWSSFMDLIDDYNGITENGTRLAVYITTRENGLSEKQAARIAKEITVDFNRKGQRSSVLNAIYMFTNANIQGHARMFRAIKNSARARWIAMSMVALGAGLSYAARAMMGKDPDTDKDKYDEISDFEKTTNWIFPTDTEGNYVKIPIAQGLHILPSIGRIAVDTILNLVNDKSSDTKHKIMHVIGQLMSLASVTADAFNPFGSAGSLPQLAMPSVLRPAMQAYENKTFTGGLLHKEDAAYNGYNAPAYEKAFKRTPGHWVTLSKLLNDFTGGDDVKPGKLNVAPETLRLLFSSVFMPGMSTNIDRALGTFEKGKDWKTEDVPILNRLHGTAPNERMKEQKTYELMDNWKQTIEQMKRYRKQAEQLYQKNPDDPRIKELKQKYIDTRTELGDGNEARGKARFKLFDMFNKDMIEINNRIREAKRGHNEKDVERLEDLRSNRLQRFQHKENELFDKAALGN